MKKIRFGIFGKAFLYTSVLLVLILGASAALFAKQFATAFEAGQKQQLLDTLQPFLNRLEGKSNDEIIAAAREFHEKNINVQFVIQDADGKIIFTTATPPPITRFENEPVGPGDAQFEGIGVGETMFYGRTSTVASQLGEGATVNSYFSGTGSAFFIEILNNSILIFALILLVSVAGAYLCARIFSRPVERLAASAMKMSRLERVPPPKPRSDEIGQLSEAVFEMYGELKETILRLQSEIAAKEKMEEAQRYFFSAASHELKTPIAATSAILEGMLEGVVEAAEYPNFLRECLKMTKEQDKLVSEILEIVKLSGSEIKNEPKPVSLSEVISGLLPVYQTLSDAKNQTLRVAVRGDAICALDENLFKRALSNILMNAIQNSPENGEIKIWTEESGFPSDKNASADILPLQPFTSEGARTTLCVFNSGTRIGEEDSEKLFDPFYRRDKARSRSLGQSGLGLAIVKKALELMNVGYSLENAEGGVLFKMDLPDY